MSFNEGMGVWEGGEEFASPERDDHDVGDVFEAERDEGEDLSLSMQQDMTNGDADVFLGTRDDDFSLSMRQGISTSLIR
jgi:hypothetical protein